MTELKIKQADINNNGNQKLMGENEAVGWGGGGLKILYGSCLVAGGCAQSFELLFFFSSENM